MGSLFKNPRGSLAEKHPSTLKLKGWKDILYHLQQSVPVHTEQCGRRTAWPSSHQLLTRRLSVTAWCPRSSSATVCTCHLHLSWVDGWRNGHSSWMDGEEDIHPTWRDGHPSWRGGYSQELIPKAPLAIQNKVSPTSYLAKDTQFLLELGAVRRLLPLKF